MRAPVAGAVAVATVVLLSGCFGPGKEVLIQRASDEFDVLVKQASSIEVEVLHTLEVEPPASESCATDSSEEHTVFIAAGTMAIQTTAVEEREVLAEFAPLFADEELWTEIASGLGDKQRAYVDIDGISASIQIDDGLLVIAVFSPCRG